MKAIGILVTLSVLGLAGLSLWAQPVGTSPGVSVQPVPASQPASQPANERRSEESAAELIQNLLKEKPRRPLQPTVPATAPAVQPDVAGEPAMQALSTPPGSVIVDRLGRLVKDDQSQWWTFHFESEKNVLREAPLRILPNRQLEAMETISDNGSKPGVKFRVSGEVTEYRGQKYLLLRKILVEREMGAL